MYMRSRAYSQPGAPCPAPAIGKEPPPLAWSAPLIIAIELLASRSTPGPHSQRAACQFSQGRPTNPTRGKPLASSSWLLVALPCWACVPQCQPGPLVQKTPGGPAHSGRKWVVWLLGGAILSTYTKIVPTGTVQSLPFTWAILGLCEPDDIADLTRMNPWDATPQQRFMGTWCVMANLGKPRDCCSVASNPALMMILNLYQSSEYYLLLPGDSRTASVKQLP